MKRLLLLALTASLCITTVYAKTTTTLKSEKENINLRTWHFSDVHEGYGIENKTSHGIEVRVYANKAISVNQKSLETDRVSLTCNGKVEYLIPDTWTICIVEPNHAFDLEIGRKDFQNGAFGLIEAERLY